MMKKSLLLTALTFSIAMPHKTLRAELSGPQIAGLAIAAAGTLCGLYAVGKQCDVWGNPNPHEILRQSNCLLENVIRYRNVLDVYITAPSEDFLYTLAIDNVHLDVHSWQLEHQCSEILECLNYMRDSRHYYMDTVLQEQLRALQANLNGWARDLRSFENYLAKHALYFALFAEEKRCLNKYAQENALYATYAYNPEYLKNQMYQQAQCKYHDTYAMISYIKQLECDINALQSCINKALGYNRAAYAQRMLDVMRYLHQLIVNDPNYTRLVNDYNRFKAEQERLRMERERLEYERMQAAAERARLARERERAEYARVQAQREREQAYQLQRERDYAAQREREQLARDIKYNLQQQNHALDREKQQVEEQLRREHERARQIEQQECERTQAEAHRRQENERVAREQEERRREQDRQKQAQTREKEESLKRREAEREQARKEETERAEQRRKYEEEQRKKRKQQEKAAEEARKQQELKDEQYRYMVFDQFV